MDEADGEWDRVPCARSCAYDVCILQLRVRRVPSCGSNCRCVRRLRRLASDTGRSTVMLGTSRQPLRWPIRNTPTLIAAFRQPSSRRSTARLVLEWRRESVWVTKGNALRNAGTRDSRQAIRRRNARLYLEVLLRCIAHSSCTVCFCNI